jgi:hypothetical protein
MATIRNADLGTVTDVRPQTIKRMASYGIPGLAGSYLQNLVSEERNWLIKGYFQSVTQAQFESLEQLRDGEVAMIDMTSLNARLYGWCKVRQLEWGFSEYQPQVAEYRLSVGMVPCIGTTVCLDPYSYIHDINYQTSLRMIDPFAGRHNASFPADHSHIHSMYVANTNAAEKTLELETWCGDDLVDTLIEGWKASAWATVGRWGSGHTAYGSTVSFTDDDSVAHTFRVNWGLRQAALANFTYPLTNYPGNKYHVGIQMSTMSAAPGTYPVSTKYGSYQLLLRVTLEHSERDALRPYPVVTYQDGGFGGGPA